MYIRLLDSELHCVSYVRLVPPFISLPVGCFVSTTVETVDGRRQEKKKVQSSYKVPRRLQQCIQLSVARTRQT